MATLFSRDKEKLPSADPFAAPAATPARGSTPAAAPTGPEPTIRDVVTRRLVTAEFQPIVRLDTTEPVAFEAFARGPVGTALNAPRAMFGAAEQLGLSAELDQVAHAAAYRRRVLQRKVTGGGAQAHAPVIQCKAAAGDQAAQYRKAYWSLTRS